MAYIGWRFPPLCGGSRQGYTKNDIEAFKGEELIDNLAREICQNSLDAKTNNSDDPVKVVFELKKVSSDLSVFKGYKNCIQGCRDCWGEKADPNLKTFLDNAELMLEKSEIPILVAGDYNTEGLPGSGDRDISSAWEALTGSEGVSVKFSETSGGSFGVGKNAPFACSALSMVFYNTYASDGKKAFVGVGKLATLKNSDGKETQGIGKYQVNNDEEEDWHPITDKDTDDFRDLFRRSEQGTDVVIVGFAHENEWIKNVSKAVLKNFFVAINEGNLIVDLIEGNNQISINLDTLPKIISDFANDPEMIQTTELYKAYTDPDKRVKLTILNENDAEIYLKTDSSFKRVIAYFRDNGMLIYKKSRRILQHYAAVFIVRGEELSELLRSTEPARHNLWDYKRIDTDKEKRKKARDALKKIDEDLLELLKSQFENPIETSIDAPGLGKYLPDTMDSGEGASQGDDILKPKIKIGKIKSVRRNQGRIIDRAGKSMGTEKKGDIHNASKNPTLPFTENITEEVDPKGNGAIKSGVAKGKGTKTITSVNLSKQRAFPVNSNQGLYKIVIFPEESYDNLYVSCSAFGEDGKTDLLNIESFTYNGNPINIKNNKAGPIKVEENKPATLYVRFEDKEKMVLSLNITEG